MPIWTKEQSDAINKENTNIIVSAGAGSGKTAVLSERVIRKLKDNINIDELLIMTFTKAAASEMKERIRKKIKKDDTLKEQLKLIDSAYITTFDSFALSVVKKYHYLLNISNNIKIVDNTIITLKKEQFLEEIFEINYKENKENFIKLINDFCTKDDTEIKKQILNINSKLDMLPNKIEFLKNYINNYYDINKINKDIEKYVNLIKEHINSLKENIDEISNYATTEFMQKLQTILLPLLNSKTYDEIKNNISIKAPRLEANSTSELKEAKEKLNKKLSLINNLCRYENEKYLETSYLSTKKYAEAICQILIEFDNKLMQYKYENDIYEFSDIANLSIKLVKEYPEVQKELKNKFKEIMIDEYQDTNDLQEEFVSYIANNNVYMVGDIKQSIYRFRNANPYIFKNKYDNYALNKGGYKIDLNKNFRSRLEVLENINLIFNLIMDDAIGGADYIKSHQMIFGNKIYIETGKTQQNNNLELLEYLQTEEFSKDEIECFIIASDIINKIENKYLVFDKDEEKLRPITYSDFVILLDRSSKFELFKKIFEYMKVPLNILKDEKINNTQDIYVINNLLKFIIKISKKEYDKEFKYLYISIARSFLFKIEDNKIFETFLNNNFYLTEPFIIANTLTESLNSMNSTDFLQLMLEKFDFYNKLITIGSIEESIVKIDNILQISKELNELSYTTYDFCEYLNKMIKEDYKMTYSINNDYGDAVKIMTIHKSKGLEYHICYFANLYNKFNISDLNEKILYDNQYGIITPFIDDGVEVTFQKELAKDSYIKEEISEKIRLLYVALTRAKEKMIMVLPKEDYNYFTNKTIIPNDIRNSYRSFLDIIRSLSYKLETYKQEIDIKNIGLSKDYDLIKNSNYKDKISYSENEIEIKNINISKEKITNKTYSKKVGEIFNIQQQKNIELGLVFHKYLENYDFKNPKRIEDKFVEEKILQFLKQPILKNIKKAKIYHEYEFIYDIEDVEYHGIIDLMIEYDKYIDIIDYKLKQIDDENYINQLNGYRNYIKTKTDKNINIYLYSIMDNELKKL